MNGPIERLIGLVRDWWQIDRVRISPREGRLLRLAPGDVLQLEGMTVTVIAREIDPNGSGVRYLCEGAEFTGELWVGLDAGRQADKVVWVWEDRRQRLSAVEVEVFPVTTSR